MQTVNEKIETMIIDLKTERLRELEMLRIKDMNLKMMDNVIEQHGEEQTAQLTSMGRQLKKESQNDQKQQSSQRQRQQLGCLQPQRSCRRSCCRHRQQRLIQSTESQQFSTKIIHWKKWTRAQQQQFCKFIGIHGSDFTLLESLFPSKTRKQLKRKYQELHKSRRWVQEIDSIERYMFREKRKAHFDNFIMPLHCESSPSSTDSIRVSSC